MNREKQPHAEPAGECACSRKDGGADCAGCGVELLEYWCDVCRQNVPEKRCHLCGLKARRIRP